MTFFPNLRFPGFDGEWEIRKLRELVKIYDGTHQTPNYVSNGIPFYSVEQVTANQFEKTKFITPEVFEKENKRVKLEKGDILMTRIGSIGVAKHINWDVNASFYVSLALIKQSSRIDNEYLCHFINTNFFQSELWKRTIHVAFPQKINLGEIGECFIKYPSSKEQSKISSFLTSIDNRIQTQKKIISQLKSQMSNLKDLIFEKKLRFKDRNGNIFSQWKYFKLSDLGNTFNGLSGKTKEHFGVGQKYIQYKQIFDSAKINIANCAFVDVEENENQNTVQYGDVFFTISSETPEEIGMSSVLLENVENVYLNSFCFGFRTNSLDELIPEFSQFLFRSNKFRNEIVKLAQGSTRYNMSKTEFLKLNVKLPCKDEQIKIAQFLSSISEKIYIESELLIQYENQKKYLLQNLFV
ncbi:restriction endonuclease subunit S [Flavobacterium sp.]|uniref:restriction endonuclease subunit S n=2 Tax=Flavobacteriales TaxID=200644 RepID=UPI0031D227C8